MKHKSTFKDLPVILNKDKLLNVSKQITDKALEIDSIETLKKRIVPLRDEITVLSKRFSNGYEIKSVHCKVEFNEPTIGKKSIVRSDTNELVETLNMTAEEMQEDFNFVDSADENIVKENTEQLKPEEDINFGKLADEVVTEQTDDDIKPTDSSNE